jgi:ubiquinone/menaquinone biosynthesis C-methylase UbiE
LASAGWEPGASVLDIRCGSGYPALAAAAAVRPSGRVTAIDVSPKMLAVTAARGAADGLDNIEVLEIEAEHLRFADGTFDAVICVCALICSPEPERAGREICRSRTLQVCPATLQNGHVRLQAAVRCAFGRK